MAYENVPGSAGKAPGRWFPGAFFAETRKYSPLVNVCVKIAFVDMNREMDVLLYKSFKCTKDD